MHNRGCCSGEGGGGGDNFFFFKLKAKMHFWSIHFGPILVLVPNFYSRLPQSLKMKYHVHFA